MSIEALVIILVVVLIVCGAFVPGPWRGTATPAGGYNIIGVLLTILVAIIIIVLIFAVLGGGIHLAR